MNFIGMKTASKLVMKILIFICLMVNALAFAQNYNRRELNRMELEHLYPQEFRTLVYADENVDILKEWHLFFAEKNFKSDKNKTLTNWKELFPITEHKVQRVEGKRIFYGLFPKKYRYTLIQDPEKNKIIVSVKIHFYESKTYKKYSAKLAKTDDPESLDYPTTDELFYLLKRDLLLAEMHWNMSAPENVGFRFEMVNNAKDADYSLKLTKKTGGLYDKYVHARPGSKLLAHEIGHMMGLDDEYKVFTTNILKINRLIDKWFHKNKSQDFSYQKDIGCNTQSLMCSGQKLYPYHFEQILRKIEIQK